MGIKRLEPRPENQCFGCGGGNPRGMRLAFDLDEEAKRAVGRFRIGKEFQGAEGVLHGGIVAALLDEAMGKLNHGEIGPAMTAELMVEYRRPVPVGEEIIVEAYHRGREGRNVRHAGEIRNAKGEVLAYAEARFVRVDPELIRNRMREAAKAEDK
jgi:uncharacterized protein (TIGR00369 family)